MPALFIGIQLGLNQAGGTHLMLEYNVFIETVRYNGGDLVIKLDKDFALGLGAKLLSTGTENEVNAAGVTTGNTFSESYMDIDLAGAYRLSYYCDVGLTAKYISKNLAGTTASTIRGGFWPPLPDSNPAFNRRDEPPKPWPWT